MIISATSPRTAPAKHKSTAFKRDFSQFETNGLIAQTPQIVAQTCAKIGAGEISTKDGALRTAYALLERHRSNPFVDSVVGLLERQSRDGFGKK